jgi:hypothetical protein
VRVTTVDTPARSLAAEEGEPAAPLLRLFREGARESRHEENVRTQVDLEVAVGDGFGHVLGILCVARAHARGRGSAQESFRNRAWPRRRLQADLPFFF